MAEAVQVPALPVSFTWLGQPVQSDVSGNDSVFIAAGGKTDLFVDPDGSAATLNAPCLLADVSADYVFTAAVEVGFTATYDAGALVLWSDDRTWAKLALEYSPQLEPTIVSVVTRGVSDDCNSFPVTGQVVWLRIARLGSAFAFHASADGSFWRLIRYFRLQEAGVPRVGLSAQSPLGDGCKATFRSLRLESRRLVDIRNGE